MGEPYGTPPLGRGWGWVGNMATVVSLRLTYLPNFAAVMIDN